MRSTRRRSGSLSLNVVIAVVAATLTIGATQYLLNAQSRGAVTSNSSAFLPVASVQVTPADAALAISWSVDTDGTGVGHVARAWQDGVGVPVASCESGGSSCQISGLTNGVPYRIAVTATRDGKEGQPSDPVTATPFPAVLKGPTARLWLDGADPDTLLTDPSCTGATANEPGAVGCWRDKSQSANHAVGTGNSLQPRLATVGTRRVPTFDGTDDHLRLTAVSRLPVGKTPSTTFVVARMTDPNPDMSSWRTVVSWGSPGRGQAVSIQKAPETTTVLVAPWAYLTCVDADWTRERYTLVSGVVTSTSYRGAVNGTAGLTKTGTFNTGTKAGLVGAQLDWGPGAVQSWHGQIAEIVVLEGAADQKTQATIEQYLSKKWGIDLRT